ncbi:YndM family protein [Bacillus timonensis]|uniref:YndM family protein n=1 Tax=Bacillus timonensis TaxID=1033734 RepID=UPI00028950C0|nr:YndM family protein [Bacillus timonensis]
MRHFKAIGIKFIVISIVLLSLFAIFRGASISNILLMSLLVTGIAYLIGDLFTLPRMGNAVATIADFGLSFFSIWFLSYLFMENTSSLITASLTAAALITASEALFHAYMQKKVLKDENQQQISRQLQPSFQTEFAEENDINPDEIKKK